MKRYIKIIEDINLKPKTWSDININELSEEQLNSIWTMYKKTYLDIGLTLTDLKNLQNKYRLVWLIDVDRDNIPDAFILYKVTGFGHKITLMGSDGEKESKKALITKLVSLLKQKYWYAEVSHKVKVIIVSNNVDVVGEESLVRRILKEYNIEWVGNGEYKRDFPKIGKVIKSLVGKVKMNR